MKGRTNTGGGSGLQDTDAVLRVQAPAGSVVTITKGGATKTDAGHVNISDSSVYDYYFIIHQSQFDSVNPWTVTATLNGQTASGTIIINLADEYDILLAYELHLYTVGDQSGWTALGWKYDTSASGLSARAPTITYGSAHMEVAITSGGSYSGVAYHAKVDLTSFSVVRLTGSFSGSAVLSENGLFIVDRVGESGYDNIDVAKKTVSSAGSLDWTLDISNLTGEYYVCIATARNSGYQSTFSITGVWLE